MWHLFDRYKGVVWPKARQMNLIARILNNICEGVGIKLNTPTNPSPATPVTISVDTEWLNEKIAAAAGGVTSVNEEDGALTVNGGKGIKVETEGKTITISYEEGKEPDEGAVDGSIGCNEWSGDFGGGGGAGGGGGPDISNDWSDDGIGKSDWSEDNCFELNGW